MSGGSDGNWIFCNYCGKPVNLSSDTYNHVVLEHAAEVHVGPGEFDPGRGMKGLAIVIGGMVAVIACLAVVLFGFTHVMDEGWALPVIVGSIVGMLGMFAYGELYSRKGRKSEKEIMMDLTVLCEICQQRMANRDFSSHVETHHPEERTFEKRVLVPMAVVMFSLIGLGFAGMMAAFFLGDSGTVSARTAILLFVSSAVTLAMGLAVGYLFDKRYYRPRMEKLEKEWSERHPGSKRD